MSMSRGTAGLNSLQLNIVCLQGFLLVTIALALQVDKVVAKAQRRELGLCEHCGGMNDPALCKAGKCPAIQR